MYKGTSQTITEEGKAKSVPLKQWKFNLANGKDGTMTVSDQLLDNATAAEERAKSEFLKNGYKMQEVQFSTHRTDLRKNDSIKVRGVNYLIKGKSTQINSVSMITTIRAVRYD